MFHLPTSAQKNPPASFPVNDVTPAAKALPTETLGVHAAKRFRRKVLLLPDSERLVANSSLYIDDPLRVNNRLRFNEAAVRRLNEVAINRCHPLIDAVATSFSKHYPLTLSPDSIWLAIEQGFAHHVLENSETLRHRLVRHQGSGKLTALLYNLGLSDFELAISDISRQIREATDTVLHECLICDFSTTTPAIRTASEIVLMDCYSSYFTYEMQCVCGIPKITLLGTPDDWQRIRARIEVLATFNLEWWAARLRLILDEFVLTAAGRPDLKFWQAIYKPRQTYGTETVTGWIADLFPYLDDPPNRRRNHVFEHKRENWALPVQNGVKTAFGDGGAEMGVAPRRFPSGLASVPVQLTVKGSDETRMIDLVGGFVAIEQDPQDLALSALIGWCVTVPRPDKPVLIFG